MPDDILQARTEQFAREPAGVPDAVASDVTADGAGNDAEGAVGAGDHLDRGVHGHAGQPRRDDRDPGAPRGSARQPERASVDGQRVHADVRGAAVDRGGVGRAVRAPAAAGDRHRDLHGGVRGGRAGPVDPGARRRARGPGSGRRDRDAADADDPVCLRAGRAAWAGAGHLGRDQRSGRRARAAGRRRDRQRHLLALDLLAQRPDRARARAADPAAARREPRTRIPARSARSGPGQRRPRRDRVGTGPRQRGRLDLRGHRRFVRRRRRAAGLLRRVGASHRASDAADALLPQPDVRAGQRRQPAHVLRHVRRDLLHLAVLSDRAGALAVSVGAADPALDGDADARRADRRRALGPHRRPPA